MHTLESYATSCGLKIDKPFILEKFYPLPFEKYITLQSSARIESSTYGYWQEVVDLISPYLNSQNIKIVQVGNKEEKNLNRCVIANGELNINQLAYVIRRSMLHCGVDGLPSHLASGYTKIVGLHPNTHVSQSKPYWSQESDMALIEPERNGKRPFYFVNGSPNVVNSIAPEKIAKEILGLIAINHGINHTSINLGSRYTSEAAYDFVLNQTVTPTDLSKIIDLRLDYYFDEKNLINQLNICKANIYTDKAINKNILKSLKSRINHIYYVVGNDDQPEFVKDMVAHAIPFSLVSFLPYEQLNDKKIHYYDMGGIIKIKAPPSELINKFKSLKNLYFRSCKLIVASGKTYASKLHWKNDTEVNPSEFNPVIDDAEFWEDLEYYYLIQKP